jgi:hypothetical protein
MLRRQRLRRFFPTREKIDRVERDNELPLERPQAGVISG